MGIPLKRYEADAAVFLCDADHGEKTERSAQGGQRPSGNSGADDIEKSGERNGRRSRMKRIVLRKRA